MNIAMFTNTYEPMIGGLNRSVATFAEDLRAQGHRVLIVTLEFPGAEESNDTVFRLPAVKNVAGTDFSIKLPVPTGLANRLDTFSPDIIHSHHPYMLGDTALRIARRHGVPLVFTHHTLYERYAYLFSRESAGLERMAAAIATQYANLCDRVVAPTTSIKRMIRDRGVSVPIEVIPTGVDVALYERGHGQDFRQAHKIPQDAFVLGYLGRVVEAKNMTFLTKAAIQVLSQRPDAWFLLVGDGDAVETIRQQVREAGIAGRVVMTGSLQGPAIADAYAAMDVFVFASKTETQGIVLIESLCAGVPVVALDARGTRDILRDGKTGVLLDGEASCDRFATAIKHVTDTPGLLSSLRSESRRHARKFDRKKCATKLIEAYTRLRDDHHSRTDEPDLWPAIQEGFMAEWDLFKEKLAVVAAAAATEDE